MKNRPKNLWNAAANVKYNGDFIVITTNSGYSSTTSDPKGKEIFLEPDANNITLGQTVIEALGASRIVCPGDKDWELFSIPSIVERYKEWVPAIMKRFGYKTKRAMFRKMHSCSIRVYGNSMQISPSHHEKIEAWGRQKGDGIEDVIIPADSSPAEVGAALRLAFSRCTGGF